MHRSMTYAIAPTLLAAAVGVPLVGFGLPVGARASVEPGFAVQSVNRAHKGDRLRMPTAAEKPQPPRQPRPTIMVGCEPVFSTLTASASANFSGRCVV